MEEDTKEEDSEGGGSGSSGGRLSSTFHLQTKKGFFLLHSICEWEMGNCYNIFFPLYILKCQNGFCSYCLIFLGMQNRTWLHLISSQLREMLVMIGMFFFMMSYL